MVPEVGVVGVVASPGSERCREGRPRVRLPVIHSPRWVGGMAVCDRDRTGSIKQAASPSADGGQTQNGLASGHVRTCSRRRPGRAEGADVPVA